jgi:hypothetical protein
MPTMITITITYSVVCVVSVRVGHTTLRTSARELTMKSQATADRGLHGDQRSQHHGQQDPAHPDEGRLVGIEVEPDHACGKYRHRNQQFGYIRHIVHFSLAVHSAAI